MLRDRGANPLIWIRHGIQAFAAASLGAEEIHQQECVVLSGVL